MNLPTKANFCPTCGKHKDSPKRPQPPPKAANDRVLHEYYDHESRTITLAVLVMNTPIFLRIDRFDVERARKEKLLFNLSAVEPEAVG